MTLIDGQQWREVEEATGRFDDWAQPWRFVPEVASQLDGEAACAFGELVQEVKSCEQWRNPDLTVAANEVLDSLTRAYPWLGRDLIRSIVRAVSYENR